MVKKPNQELLNAPAPRRGFWSHDWQRYRRRKLGMVALAFVIALGLAGALSPAIVGTKPIVCSYKGNLYFPALGYYNRNWENPVFNRDRFRFKYPKNLIEKDANSWAVWPLVYQDPVRRVTDDEWPGQPENPARDQGAPSHHNLFGTNRYGVDVFAQIIHGARTAFLVGFVSMGIASIIGIAVGAAAGYFGGWIDALLSRFVELIMCIPPLVLILALIAVLQRPTIWHLMAVLGCTRWTDVARLTRGEFLRLREMEFVSAARALGASRGRIMFLHILRNALAPVLVPITFGIAAAILIESGLSFLGFGAPPPNPSWGTLLNEGRSNQQMWWLIVFPGATIFLTVLAYNVIGESLQEATDPRLRQDAH